MNKSAFYLLTDCHYVSKSCWEEGESFTRREKGDQIVLKLSPEILDTFVDRIIADNETDSVLFLGDNVNSGDMNSHYEFRERLQKLKDAGKNVYITYATHDYCSPNGEDECFQKGSLRYTATGTEPVPFMLRSGLEEFYEDFGHKQALSIDSESGSYVVKIGDCLRLIAIIDNGNGRSHCGLFEKGMKWLSDQIDDAKDAGDYVVLAVHHPVIPPWEVYRHKAHHEVYGGHRQLSELMCKKNVRVVFTGHTHVQNIREFTGSNGNRFYDVSTISLVNAAGKMRKISVDESGICSVSSIGLDSINGVDTGGESVFDYLYKKNFTGLLESSLPFVNTDFDRFIDSVDGFLPVEKLKKHKGIIKLAFNKLSKLNLSTLARFGKTKKQLSKEQLKYAKSQKALDSVFVVLSHIFSGNAPYTPDTAENIIFGGVAKRIDRLTVKFKIEALLNLIPPGSSLYEMLQDFLYNNRTGDDDSIEFSLK